MPNNLIIHGGRPLAGEVQIQGSKNTALPLIAACLLTEESCVLENVPEISDVATMAEIARGTGAIVEWDKPAKRLLIQAKSLGGSALNAALARKLRASILFSGALLGRLREALLPYPGGDAIGSRPLSTRLRALEALGVRVREDEKEIALDGRALAGAEITLEEPSVTATENAILAAVVAPGKTAMRLAAFEPHVQELVKFLARMGAT